MLAGVSVDYYTRLERGVVSGVSASVLEAIARALLLDEAETLHLFNLAHVPRALAHRPSTPEQAQARPSVRRLLDAMRDIPAFVRNTRFDVLYANRLAAALFSPLYADPVRPVNLARFAFLAPAGRRFYGDWEDAADYAVALLHTEAGRNPDDRALAELISELHDGSEDFRRRWVAHDVGFHRTGVKKFHHPAVGEISLVFEAMELAADPGLTITAYTPEPGTPAEDALRRLAHWAASQDRDAEVGVSATEALGGEPAETSDGGAMGGPPGPG